MAPTRFEALPHAVQLRIFGLLPLDTRLRCIEVSRAWRSTLQDTAAWTHVVLPPDFSPVRRVVLSSTPQQQLQAAVARSGGMLQVLDTRHVEIEPLDVLRLVIEPGLGSMLRELHFSLEKVVSQQHIVQIINAAPELQVLSVAVNWKEGNITGAASMLRNEPPFQAVRISTLVLNSEFTNDDVIRNGNAEFYQPLFAELQAEVAQCNYPEFRDILVKCHIDDVIMGYIADVAEAHTPALRVTGLEQHDEWPSGCIGVVVRLLRSNALPELTFGLWASELLREGDPAVWTELCEAVQGCTSLDSVSIDRRVVQRLSRLNELIAALVNNPRIASISVIDCDEEHLEEEAFVFKPKTLEMDTSYRFGRGLAALLAANLPALRRLSLVDMGLDDAGLKLVLRALARNTHLEHLTLGWSHYLWATDPVPTVPPYFSTDFTESELLPAVQRSRSLRSLVVEPCFSDHGHGDPAWHVDEEQLERQQAVRAVEALVRDRSDPEVQAAARGWQVARYKWTAPRAQR